LHSLLGRVKLLEEKHEIDKTAFAELPDPEVLKGSLIEFTKYFYKVRTGRDFLVRPAHNRQSFCDQVVPLLESSLRHDPNTHRLAIRCPPRYGKTEIFIHFICWALANHPDSSFIYVSYNWESAVKNTKVIRRIVTLPAYKQLFGLQLVGDSRASDNFEFNTGGAIVGVGAEGTITGRGAGIPDIDRFGGAIIIDDIHKPSEITSEKYRQRIKNWWFETLASRVNNPKKTPILAIGQALHEDDLIENLIEGMDVVEWTPCIIPALDTAGNALMPAMHTEEMLLQMKEKMPYEFASQYQQNPVPAGGGLFKEEWFAPLLDDIPDNIEATFITVDTAETDKTYNDPTVFSFWGVYKTKIGDQLTDTYSLHWIDCVQLWLEPKDLQDEFLSFYNGCLRFNVKPAMIAIEKKSTGVTLLSTLKQIPGLRVIEIERTRASGNKSTRFIEMQKYVASKRITLHNFGKHTSMCIEHMSKITANDSHRHDDICDTAYDAVRMALIDETVINLNRRPRSDRKIEGYKAYSKKSFTTWNQT
jgi:predicted phage terminase large subunit-like protein